VHNTVERLYTGVIRSFVFFMLFSVGSAHANVVDRIVAVVEKDLVMQSDVRFEEIVSGIDDSGHPFWDQQRSTPTQRLIDAAVIRKLAGTVSLYAPPPEEVIDRLARIRARFGADAGWQNFLQFWGLNDVNFARLLRRRMIVERYLNRNMQPNSSENGNWDAEFNALMQQVRGRFRIRMIPKRSATQ